ncbi:MAG: glutathione synthase [Bdellovibrionota bacterium]
MSLHLAFIIDPLPSLKRGHDTSLAFMDEAQKRGHEIHYCEIGDLSARDGKLLLNTRIYGKEGKSERRPDSHFNLILMRKDPPVDRAYLDATYFLDLSKVPVWNSPSGLREASEKMFSQRFPGIFPETLVSQNKEELLAFLSEMGGKMVVKPVDGFAGKGVFAVSADDANRSAILETLTSEWRRPVMAQRFLPEVKEGDRRIILLDGEPMGVLVRLPAEGEFRANMAAGGKTKRGEVSASDRKLIAAIKPALLEWGLHFVGLDVIGNYVTEINVTSPTGLIEIAQYDGVNLAGRVVDLWEKTLGGR